jgi:hypothetical protein
MKLSNVSFPHPVLGINQGLEPDINGEFIVFYEDSVSDLYKVNIEFNLYQNQIKELINSGNAVYACEVNCRKTAYRELFTTSDTSQSIVISTDLLRDEVSWDFFVIATKEFNYTEKGEWHPDYKNKTFSVEKGMPLAYGGQKRRMIEWDPLSEGKNSLITVEPSKDDTGPFTVDLQSDTINIFLPKKTFMIFEGIYQSRPEYQDAFHASLAVPAIAKAISAMESSESSDLEDKKWFQTIGIKLENDARLSAEDDTFKKAQMILDNPFSTLSQRLSVVSQNEEE